jgi:hypothetical protein
MWAALGFDLDSISLDDTFVSVSTRIAFHQNVAAIQALILVGCHLMLTQAGPEASLQAASLPC